MSEIINEYVAKQSIPYLEQMEPIKEQLQQHQVEFLHLDFTNLTGGQQRLTLPIEMLNENLITEGKTFDGSSLLGWKAINESDMTLMPDLDTFVIDPFSDPKACSLVCDIYEPNTMQPYERDPRSLAKRAEQYLQATGIADVCYMGPEPEFFIFDDVRFGESMGESFYFLDSDEAAWNSNKYFEEGNLGHRPRVKGGYFPLLPIDSAQTIRARICQILTLMGITVEAHHHEVATANQNEVATKYNSLLKKADELQKHKYIVHNVAQQFGKTATFMPKPLLGDNGSGMHCHQSLAKDGRNLFSGDRYAGLSELALYYMGGIMKHARAINAFTNPTTNSYKRLVPGFEAPVMLAYSARNRSAAIRIPVSSSQGRRIEVRFPDPSANPYFAFTAMMMAGIDGIKNKILPGDPLDKDLYDLPPEEAQNIPTVAASLEEALAALMDDCDFLFAGGVFSQDLLKSYIRLKQVEINRLRSSPHPLEFDLYYSC